MIHESCVRLSAASAEGALRRKNAAELAMNAAQVAHYPLEPYGEITRWFAGISALPAWQKTLAQARPQASAA